MGFSISSHRGLRKLFTVRLETTESVRVTVSEGRVTVGHAVSDALRLQPTETIDTTVQVSTGETVVFDGATIDLLQTLDLPELSGRLAWRNGMLMSRCLTLSLKLPATHRERL